MRQQLYGYEILMSTYIQCFMLNNIKYIKRELNYFREVKK